MREFCSKFPFRETLAWPTVSSMPKTVVKCRTYSSSASLSAPRKPWLRCAATMRWPSFFRILRSCIASSKLTESAPPETATTIVSPENGSSSRRHSVRRFLTNLCTKESLAANCANCTSERTVFNLCYSCHSWRILNPVDMRRVSGGAALSVRCRRVCLGRR